MKQQHKAVGIGRALTLSLIVCAFPLTATEVSAQWTQWGGAGQDFKSDSTGLADSWPADGPKKLWTRELGEGYSAILAENGRIYTMYRDKADKKEIVIDMDAGTGETIWEYKYRSQPAEGHANEFGRGPRSTPLIVGDRIYTIGVAGKMHCLNKKDGKKIWGKNLWGSFKGNKLNHGYSSSPIAYGDTVIVLVGGKGASVVAFDQESGKTVWKSEGFENSYSTPKIIKVGGEDQLITFMATELIGMDPNNGDLKWQYAIENRWKQNVCMPTWDEESSTLFLSSNGPGSRGLKLTPSGDKTNVEELWSTKKIQLYHVTSVGIGDYVYGSSGSRGPSFFSAINIKTGEIAWRERGFAKATCVYADGKMIILDEDGQLGLATVTPEKLTVHAKVALLDKVAWTVPTIDGGTLFVRDKKNIMALDLTGRNSDTKTSG